MIWNNQYDIHKTKIEFISKSLFRFVSKAFTRILKLYKVRVESLDTLQLIAEEFLWKFLIYDVFDSKILLRLYDFNSSDKLTQNFFNSEEHVLYLSTLNAVNLVKMIANKFLSCIK